MCRFEVTQEDWNEVVELNLNAVFFMSQRIGRSMAARRYGKIINIASMDSFLAVFWFRLQCQQRRGCPADKSIIK